MNSYKFIVKLSDNKFTQTWHVLDPDNNDRILKFPSDNPDLPIVEINKLLRNSFPLQRQLYSHSINRPIKKHIQKNTYYLEYPFLSRDIWQPLTPNLFWDTWPESVRQVGLITDYLHQLGMVHLDLKLENFQIKK